MKQNGTLSNFQLKDTQFSDQFEEKKRLEEQEIELIGDHHVGTNAETPLRADAFALDDQTKIEKIAHHFKEIMHILGLDLTDDSLKGTPLRVAKMYVKEAFGGLNPANMPEMKLFENKYGYGQMLVEKDITLYSHCEHHFVPIVGKVHVAYISAGKVVGLSKINRLVNHFAKRPQVQERLTNQIGQALCKYLETKDIAVIVDAAHLCVSSRGIQDVNSSTVTAYYSGAFEQKEKRDELFAYLNIKI